ncbi:MAG: hypothetical protein M0Z99_32115 [Betaproteobacteria bacterium]|nr:hypothetical protein [Betaproteobacteria bacterium]
MGYESACSGDCNQGRNCTCAPSRDDDLGAARGIVNGLLLVSPIWALIILALWMFA